MARGKRRIKDHKDEDNNCNDDITVVKISRKPTGCDPPIGVQHSVEPGEPRLVRQPADCSQPQLVRQAGSSAAAQPAQQPVQVNKSSSSTQTQQKPVQACDVPLPSSPPAAWALGQCS